MTPADAWSYGLLYDLRLMTGRLTLAELPPILGRASQNPLRRAARTPRHPGDQSTVFDIALGRRR
jgi:hypothetical protein